ncbi:MAG: C25 family cysteine peptidase [Gammaproteobacteria bacterium]|nr:C25 family cysteine peptidase [Gammaproteobacteria bacterium]
MQRSDCTDGRRRVYRPAPGFALALLALGMLAGWAAALAGTSGGAGSLLVQSGSSAALNRGDYVSSAAGLNTYHRYFIEVPPGTSSLQIDIFDLDVGANHDQVLAGGMFVRYTIFNPNGLAVFGPFSIPPNACPACDNIWVNLFTQSAPPPIPGHWELRIDTSSAVTASNDDQGYGVRAHDGNPGAGGRELNVYVDSFFKPGQIGPGVTGGTVHPYVTRGCSAQSNDFDWDMSPSPGLVFSSVDPDPSAAPAARFTTGPLPTSGDAVWLNQSFGGWTSDTSSSDYGIWSLDYTLSSPLFGNTSLLYVGNQSAAAPPPVAQPQPNTFRIYFPSDGGAPPVKPRLGQDIVGVVSGADPPATNQTTVVRLAVGISNPTPYPITFSAPSNVVSAEIPFVSGNRVRYEGNASATQGVIVSQPGIGSTGNVVWNPGTVPAGGTAQLEYDVSVRPPPSLTRVVITGTPAAGGTTARYVDETCSGAACGATALARATHTLGPLCELAVNTGVSLATLAVVGDLRAYRSKQGTVVEWETLYEHGTAGFHLLRLDANGEDYVRVSGELLPALLHSPNGGTYRYVDPEARPGGTYTYQLVEVEVTGNVIHHGPYTVEVAHGQGAAAKPNGARRDTPVRGLEREPRAPSAAEQRRAEARKAARRAARLARHQRKGDAAKIMVRESGLYFLSAAAIADALGIAPGQVRKLIAQGGLSLSNRAIEVATLAAANDDGLYFYGEGVGRGEAVEASRDRRDDMYTAQNVYWLQRARGLAMNETGAGAPAPAGAQRFVETVRAEGNRYSLTHLFDDPDGDYWMWDFRVGGIPFPDCADAAPRMPCYIRELPLPSPGVVPDAAAGAVLTVNLHGGSDTPADVDHAVTVTVNGEPVGATSWSGLAPHTASFEVPHELLRDGGNRVGVDAAAQDDPSFISIVYIDDLELRYVRAARAAGDALAVPSAGYGTAAVDGFSGADVWTFDISDPRHPVRLVNAVVEEGAAGYRVRYVTGSGPRTYLSVSPRSARAPDDVVADKPSRLRLDQPRVDYLVITDASMLEAAEAHAAYRRARGLRTLVVDLEDIYDEFNHGIPNADAIWQFLHHAHTRWQPAPRYVLLAGEGSFDYRDYLGNGDAVIPTLLTATPRGLFPSDNLYADVIGNDRLPEMAIGRLPVIDAAELRAFTAKIAAYEAATGDAWKHRVLLAADAPDDGGNFPADSELVAGEIPEDLGVERIYGDSVDPATATQRLIGALNDGRGFVNFIGHGSSIAIGNRNLLRIDDLERLANGDRLPVLTAQTCLAGQFGFPGVDGIGELLVLSPDRGAIAVWAPSGLSMNNRARVLGQGFYRGTFAGGERIIGESILGSQIRYLESHADEYLLDIYNLIGDPATVMR